MSDTKIRVRRSGDRVTAILVMAPTPTEAIKRIAESGIMDGWSEKKIQSVAKNIGPADQPYWWIVRVHHA